MPPRQLLPAVSFCPACHLAYHKDHARQKFCEPRCGVAYRNRLRDGSALIGTPFRPGPSKPRKPKTEPAAEVKVEAPREEPPFMPVFKRSFSPAPASSTPPKRKLINVPRKNIP